MKLNEMDNAWPEYGRRRKAQREPVSNIDVSNVTNIEVDGVNQRDYPDFSDAYISYAVWKDSGRELTDEELEQLTDENGDLVNELSHEGMQGVGDDAHDRMMNR